MAILSLQHLSLSYHGMPAVKDFSVDLSEGECLSLMGPSGAGKSSVLRMAAGLQRPDHGKILLDGKDITEKPPHERQMAMVFQNMALFPHTKIRDNITYGMYRLGYSRQEIEEKLLLTAEKMKISEQLNKYPSALSGGQKQRAGIARALIRNPAILLLDEPLNSLDLNLKEELLEEIRRLSKEEKRTMIYVTHDRHEAEFVSDRVALMKDGRLLADVPFSDLYDHPETVEIVKLLGNEYQILPCIAENGILRSEQGELLEKAEVKNGRYLLAFRSSDPFRREGRFLLYDETTGARLL